MATNPNGMSLLDPGQILKRVYTGQDDDALRITGDIALSEQAIGENGSPAGDEVKIAGGVDGSGNAQALHTDTSGDLQIDILTSALPTGAATSAKQDTGNTSLASIDTKVSTLATEATLSSLNGKVTAVNTGAVVVSSSALPSGASTSAKQDTEIASLSSIDGKIIAVNTGAVVVASSALPSGAATSAKQDTLIAKDFATQTTLLALSSKSAGALVPEKFDEQVITYVGATTDISTVTYKLASATVATLTLSYDGSNRLTGVVKT